MEKEIKDEDLFIPKTKHKGLKIMLAIILIALLGVGGYFLYQEKFNNPKATVMNIINDAEKDAGKFLDFSENNDDKYKINGLLKIDATLPNEYKELAKIIRNIDLQFSGEVDNKNSIFNFNLNTKYKNDSMIDIKSYYEKDNLYLLLDGLYDKYLKISLDDIKKSQADINMPEVNIKEKDFKTITSSFTNAFKKALEELEFIKEEATITIDDKGYNVNNNYTVLKDKDVNKFIKNIVTTLSKDNDLKTVLKKFASEDVDKIFDETIKSIDELEFKDTIKLNFYTKGLLKQKLVSIRIDTTIDEETTHINFDKISDDEFIIVIKAVGAEISSRIKKTSSIANINLTANVTGIKFKIDFNTNYEKIKEVTKPDIENSKDIDKLTEQESKEIDEKLEKNSALKTLIEDIQKLNLNKQ